LKTGNADQYFAKINLQYVIGAPSMLLDSDPYRWVLEGHLTPLCELGESTIYAYHLPESQNDSMGYAAGQPVLLT